MIKILCELSIVGFKGYTTRLRFDSMLQTLTCITAKSDAGEEAELWERLVSCTLLSVIVGTKFPCCLGLGLVERGSKLTASVTLPGEANKATLCIKSYNLCY